MPRDLRNVPLPYAVLAVLVAIWIGLGAWICFAAPYGSGTDESIRYVAFVAATNHWASLEEAAIYGLDASYYPPLYYLLFAPFFGNEPAFTAGYPRDVDSPHPLRFNGGHRLVAPEALRRVPGELLRLYRAAKAVSLLLGVGVIVCLVTTLRLLFTGPNAPWLVLGGAAPLLLLPQFLYYQTLVNNDALVNFLCAAAILCFVAAARGAECGDASAFRRRGLLCAAAVGLGLLTKQSAIALAPLLPALAVLRPRCGPPSRRTAAGVLGQLVLLLAVCFASGGWWLLRSALANDVSGLQTQRMQHPWAFAHRSLDWSFLESTFSAVSRTYIATFAGDLFGVPDAVFFLYLSIAALFACLFLGAAAARLQRTGAEVRLSSRRAVWFALAATLAFNVAAVLVYNLEVVAPHGRLLFPSLLAQYALFALGLQILAGGRLRLLVALVCALILSLGGLFLWTFRHRMVAAVTQPEEHLVLLGVNPGIAPYLLKPIWGKQLQQPVLLPPGALVGLRFPLEYQSYLPQLGATIRAHLRLPGAGPETPERRFAPCSIGDADTGGRWTEIALESPLLLQHETEALFLLEAEKPWFEFPATGYAYRMVPLEESPRLGPSIVNGIRWDLGLELTAVYR